MPQTLLRVFRLIRRALYVSVRSSSGERHTFTNYTNKPRPSILDRCPAAQMSVARGQEHRDLPDQLTSKLVVYAVSELKVGNM